MERLYRIKEVAALLAVTPSTVYRMCEARQLRYVAVGAKGAGRRIPESALELFVRSRTVEPVGRVTA